MSVREPLVSPVHRLDLGAGLGRHTVQLLKKQGSYLTFKAVSTKMGFCLFFKVLLKSPDGSLLETMGTIFMFSSFLWQNLGVSVSAALHVFFVHICMCAHARVCVCVLRC